jgi:hypothetical protein
MRPSSRPGPIPSLVFIALAASLLGIGAAPAVTAPAAPVSTCDSLFWEGMPVFPRIYVCAFAGGYQDSSLLLPGKCVGSFHGPLPDSISKRPRTLTLRFRRDRRAEARSDFGGYRIYRVVNLPDTTYMVLIRRFSRQSGDDRTWNFSVLDDAPCAPDTGRNRRYCWDDPAKSGQINPNYMKFLCTARGQPVASVVNDSIVTFVDPDSNGNYIKVCRLRDPQEGVNGACKSRGDSVFVLSAPPGPHDGFPTWYAITYEGRNLSADGNYADLFVPDLTGRIGPCTDPLDPSTCPNLNNKALNMTVQPVEPTAGPTSTLERVVAVPNPFRAKEAWDQPGGNELHFINLPAVALIRIYTVAGDLVKELPHSDRIRDYERWDLKNQRGQDVASGIYLFRVEANVNGRAFTFQDRFIVIR